MKVFIFKGAVGGFLLLFFLLFSSHGVAECDPQELRRESVQLSKEIFRSYIDRQIVQYHNDQLEAKKKKAASLPAGHEKHTFRPERMLGNLFGRNSEGRGDESHRGGTRGENQESDSPRPMPSLQHLELVDWKKFLDCGSSFWSSSEALRIARALADRQVRSSGPENGGWSKRRLLSGLERPQDIESIKRDAKAYIQRAAPNLPSRYYQHILDSAHLDLNNSDSRATFDNNYPSIMQFLLRVKAAQPSEFRSGKLKESFDLGIQFFTRNQYGISADSLWKGSFPLVVASPARANYEKLPTLNDHSMLNVLRFVEDANSYGQSVISGPQRLRLARLKRDALAFIANSQYPLKGDGLWAQQYESYQGRLVPARGRSFEPAALVLGESIHLMHHLALHEDLSNPELRQMLEGALRRIDQYKIKGVIFDQDSNCINLYSSEENKEGLNPDDFSLYPRFVDNVGNPVFQSKRKSELFVGKTQELKSLEETGFSTKENQTHVWNAPRIAHEPRKSSEILSPNYFQPLRNPLGEIDYEGIARSFCGAVNRFKAQDPVKFREYSWYQMAEEHGRERGIEKLVNEIRAQLQPQVVSKDSQVEEVFQDEGDVTTVTMIELTDQVSHGNEELTESSVESIDSTEEKAPSSENTQRENVAPTMIQMNWVEP